MLCLPQILHSARTPSEVDDRLTTVSKALIRHFKRISSLDGLQLVTNTSVSASRFRNLWLLHAITIFCGDVSSISLFQILRLDFEDRWLCGCSWKVIFVMFAHYFVFITFYSYSLAELWFLENSEVIASQLVINIVMSSLIIINIMSAKMITIFTIDLEKAFINLTGCTLTKIIILKFKLIGYKIKIKLRNGVSLYHSITAFV